MLSPTKGQVAYALLTRLPLSIDSKLSSSVRLACVKHAASVRPEPGSNSPIKFIEEPIWLLLLKEINLTWSRALKALDPHIRFLIG